MVHASRNATSRRRARYVPPFTTALLFLATTALLQSSPDNDATPAADTSSSIRRISDNEMLMSPLWTSPGQELALFASRVDGGQWICPRIAGGTRQPLCRRFGGEAVAVCGEGSEILIVLSDGDIHQVDYALIGKNGQFMPVYHHPNALELVDAWLPGAACPAGPDLPEILAINRESTLMRFNRTTWRPLK
jgi:hypothetical protein